MAFQKLKKINIYVHVNMLIKTLNHISKSLNSKYYKILRIFNPEQLCTYIYIYMRACVRVCVCVYMYIYNLLTI